MDLPPSSLIYPSVHLVLLSATAVHHLAVSVHYTAAHHHDYPVRSQLSISCTICTDLSSCPSMIHPSIQPVRPAVRPSIHPSSPSVHPSSQPIRPSIRPVRPSIHPQRGVHSHTIFLTSHDSSLRPASVSLLTMTMQSIQSSEHLKLVIQ